MIKYYNPKTLKHNTIVILKLRSRYSGKTYALSKNRRIERKFKND